MAGKKIGAIIALDGEKEFKKAVTSVNSDLKVLESELKLTKEAFKGQANTLEALRAKHTALEKVIEKQKEKHDALNKALGNAKENQSKVGKGLTELKQQYQEATKRMEDMRSSSDSTDEEIQEQKKHLEELRKAVEKGEQNYEMATRRVNTWQTSLNGADTELARLSRELSETDRYMSEANNSSKKCSKSIDEYGNHVQKAVDTTNHFKVTLDTALGNIFSNMVEKTFSEIVDLSKKAVTGIYEVGSSFESQMSKVESLSGASRNAMNQLEEKAKKVGASTQFTAKQAGQGLEYMALAGWDTNEMLNAIDGTIAATAASGLELSQVSDILTDSITAFGDSADAANRYADVLASTQAKSNTSILGLGEAFKNVASTAGSYGYSLESVSASLGMMANSGIKGSAAGTQLGIVMSRLATNTNGARDTLEGLGVEFYNADGSAREWQNVIVEMCEATKNMTVEEKASIVTKIAGKNAQKGLNAILNQGSEAYNQLYGDLMNCNGAASAMAETMNDNLNGKLTAMQSALEAVGVTIYEHFEEPMKSAVEKGTGGFEKLNNELKKKEMSESLDRLAEAAGELTEKAIEFATKAIPGITKGVSWIIDHGSEVRAIIDGIGAGISVLVARKGIGMGLAMFSKASTFIKAITTSLRTMTVARTAATAAQEAETIATEAATVAQEGLNAAQSANIITAMIGAIAMLGTTIYSYVHAQKEAEIEQDKFNKKLEEGKQAREEVANSIQTSLNSSKESIQSAEDEWNANQKLIDKLYELNDMQHKTSEEKTQMQAIVTSLSNDIPELAKAFDQETGSMRMTKEEVDQLIKKKKEYALASAAQNTLQDLADAEVKSETNIKKAERALDKLKEKYKEISGYKYGSTDAVNYMKIGWKEADQLKNVMSQIRDTEEELKSYKSANKDAKEQIDICMEAVEKYGTTLDETSSSMEACGNASDQMAGAIQNSSEEAQEAYENLTKSLDDSISSSIKLFEKFSGGTQQSLDEVIENLHSQIEGLQNWKDNMVILSQQAGQGMSESFYKQLMEMGPESANIVQELVDSLKSNDGKFQEVCKSWIDAMDYKDTAPAQIADASVNLTNEIQKMNYMTSAEFQKMYDEVNQAFSNANATMTSAGNERNHELQLQWNDLISQAKASGISIPAELTAGINNGSISAQQAINAVMNLLGSTASGHIPTYFEVGSNISKGLESGILSQIQNVANAGAQLALSAANAAKKAADIHSPSRKWRSEIGLMMGAGMSLGILDKKDEIRKNSAKLVAEAYDASVRANHAYADIAIGIAQTVHSATKSVKNMRVTSKILYDYLMSEMKEKKKFYKLSLSAEKHYWEKLAEYSKKGSKQQKNAFAKASYIDRWEKNIQTRISSAFNVSKYTKGSDGKQQLKSAKDYYSELYAAADNYFNNYNVIHNVSLRQEEYYWAKVVKKMKKGTQAYYDAMKQLNSVKAKIRDAQLEAKQERQKEISEKKQYGVSGDALSNYKIYYKVSAKAEVDYWNTVRKQYKKGTAERIEADQKYFDAKKELNSKQEDLNAEYAQNVKDVNEKLKENIQDLTDAYTDAVKERKNAIYNSTGLFDAFKSTSASGAELLHNLRTQVAGIADWEQQLEQLSLKGKLDSGLLNELKEMGPEASASIHALNSLTEEQLDEYNKLWQQKNQLAESQAVKENEQLRQKTQQEIEQLKSDAQKKIDVLKAEYQKAVKELKKPMSNSLSKLADEASTIGEEAANKLIGGIKKGASANSAKANIEKVNTRISKNLGKLPKAGKIIGNQTLQGILDGLMNKKKIDKSAQEMIEELKRSLMKAADIHSPSRLFKRDIGFQVPAGIAEGIKEKTKLVNQSGIHMIEDLTEEAKRKMQASRELLNFGKTMTGADINTKIEDTVYTNIIDRRNTTDTLNALTSMLDLLKEYMPMIGCTQITMDTGALVGSTSKKMSQDLAMRSKRIRR